MSSKTPLQLVITGSQTISITELFHRLNRVLPEDQEVRTLQPNMKAPEAIRIMVECGFSQLPVVAGNEVLGVFSYRSFARTVLKMESKQWKPDDLSVDDCVEKPAFARVTDEFEQWFDHLDNQDYILVGEPGRLQGIVTAMDVLRYLYGVASPYVLMAEIELAIRAMIRWSVNEETLAKFARIRGQVCS